MLAVGVAVFIFVVMLFSAAKRRGATQAMAGAAAVLPSNVSLEEGIVFGKGGTQTLKLDMTRPKTNPQKLGPFPALVFVHGGGWQAGNRGMFRSQMSHYSQAGIVCVTVDYRLAPKHKFPAQIEDVKCAVRWLRANAKKYNIDPNRIGAVGASAGAHLVALLGTTAQDKLHEGNGGNPEQSSAVCAVIGLAGPYDLSVGYQNSVKQNPSEGTAVRSLLEEFLGGKPEQVPSQYRDASPVNFVKKGAPPFLLVHGTADSLVPIEQAETFEKKLKASGVEVEFLRVEGGTHSDFGKDPAKVLERVNSFLRQYLKL